MSDVNKKVEEIAKAAGRALGDSNDFVQAKGPAAVPVLKKVLIGLAVVAAVLAIAYAIG